MTAALAGLAALAGEEYDPLRRLDLPRVPVNEGVLTTGGTIALAAIVAGTLLTAIAGARVGERHHQVDRAGAALPEGA